MAPTVVECGVTCFNGVYMNKLAGECECTQTRLSAGFAPSHSSMNPATDSAIPNQIAP